MPPIRPRLPEPYWKSPCGNHVLYHGDCLKILPLLGKVDAVVTDPPYGIAWKRGTNNQRASKSHSGILGDEDTSLRDSVLGMLDFPGIVFGSFYAPYPLRVKQVCVWHKPPDSGLVGSVTGLRRDAEPIFLVGEWPTRNVERSCVFRTLEGQSGTTSETGHPHTKPLSLILELLGISVRGAVLDPFAGSGTTGVACIRLGRKFTGIEIEEKYCKIAAERMQKEWDRMERLRLAEEAHKGRSENSLFQ
jgi:DNA modification methylase